MTSPDVQIPIPVVPCQGCKGRQWEAASFRLRLEGYGPVFTVVWKSSGCGQLTERTDYGDDD